MAQRKSKNKRTQILRNGTLISVALFLIVACQWGGAGKLPVAGGLEQLLAACAFTWIFNRGLALWVLRTIKAYKNKF